MSDISVKTLRHANRKPQSFQLAVNYQPIRILVDERELFGYCFSPLLYQEEEL